MLFIFLILNGAVIFNCMFILQATNYDKYWSNEYLISFSMTEVNSVQF